MPSGPRYAIYFVPDAQSALFRFGSAVIGYDSYTGQPACRLKAFAKQHQFWDEITAEPRRYGFHATLKAPFHLPPSSTESELVRALHDFGKTAQSCPPFKPSLEMLRGFAAIVPERLSEAVNALAASSVTAFETFRAPMTPQDRARRVAAGLDKSQIDNLDRWGYPYVFAAFEFHMTLTGHVPVELRDNVLVMLREAYRNACGDDQITVDRVVLLRQDHAAQPFRVIDQALLKRPDQV